MVRILAINPGSTSTKLAVYDDESQAAEKTIRHSTEEISRYENILAQKAMRRHHVLEMLKENDISLSSLHAVVGRGGLLKPIPSGTYTVNGAMLEDLKSETASVHASALGGIVAHEIARECGINAYVVDPVVVDEMEEAAKISGIPGIKRKSVFHALNTKAVARRAAAALGMEYEEGRFVVAHMGGGITIGAHRYGRVIDVNDALAGEGPFTPERSGAVPIDQIVDMCYSGEYTKTEVMDKIVGKGGMTAYLGTNDLREAENMIKSGDQHATLIVDTMAYQAAKEIGAMTAVLEGRVDAIVLTGGLAYSDRFTTAIKQRVDQIAKVMTYPGEDEMIALVQGVLRVINRKEQAKVYEN